MKFNRIPSQLENVVRFIGYGRLDAPMWFLGREEGLGKRPKHFDWTLDWELSVRAGWEPVMDARQAHEQLDDVYWEAPRLSGAWIFMAMLARGLLCGATDWQEAEPARHYVVDRLGRAQGETLIGEAFPLPKARITSWPYTRLYPDQKTYKRLMWPQRQSMWQSLLEQHHPKVVVAYGGWWWSRRNTFGKLNWQQLNGGRILIAQLQGSRYIYLAPFFGRQQLTLEDLQCMIDFGQSRVM